MKPNMKFCGMTRRIDIDAAEELGVDFVGFVFVPSSPRFLTLEKATELRHSIRKAKLVGVFADHDIDAIERYVRELHLDYVQLHGTPDLEKAKAVSVPVIQAFRGVPNVHTLEEFLRYCSFVLIDKKEGAAMLDADSVAALPVSIRSKLFAAGGITPDTTRVIADRLQPYAIDAASGIESEPGIKDPQRMISFFQSLS